MTEGSRTPALSSQDIRDGGNIVHNLQGDGGIDLHAAIMDRVTWTGPWK
jgi:hypothetical protein